MSLNYEIFDLDFPVGSANKSAVLVTGESEALLVDAGFTRADGHRLVAAILDSGKTLKTVFVSHADPDFYFGLEAIADAFPESAIVATPIVIKHIQHSFEGKLGAWASLGANLPTRLVPLSELTEKRAAWVELLDEMLALNPQLVVPGHRLPKTATDASALEYTRSYLQEFERILAASADGAAATATLIETYPNSGMLIAATLGPKVAKGEMTWG